MMRHGHDDAATCYFPGCRGGSSSMTTDPAGKTTQRLAQPWKWICEFCFRLLYVDQLLDGWDFVWQSAVCPECRQRVAHDGGYAVVPGGKYATSSDPREIFTVHGHEWLRSTRAEPDQS